MLLNKMEVITKERNILTVVFFLLSLVLIAVSWSFYISPRDEPDYDRKRMVDIASCTSFARHKGFMSVQPKDSSESSRVVEISLETLDEPSFMFASVESVLLACNNIELKSFCLGVESECGINGLKMILVYEKPSVY